MAITLLGSSSVCIEASEEKWDAAIKKEHIRVQFAKPHAMRAIGVDEQKTYEVAEILIGLSDERDFKGLMIKAGGKYHQFAKFDGALWIAFQQRLLGR
jgi:hypothetical protein